MNHQHDLNVKDERIAELVAENSSLNQESNDTGLELFRNNRRIAKLEAGIQAVGEELKMQINYDAPVSASCARRCIDALAALVKS